MAKVTICGPNLFNQSKGSFHVHAADCGDLKRHARREPEYENGWTIEASSQREIVENIYADQIDEREGERRWLLEHPDHARHAMLGGDWLDSPVTWRDGYAQDVYFFPCVDLPEEEAS